MKRNWKFISGLFVAILLTVSACEFFTNKPGAEELKMEDVDIAITNVEAPLSAKYGEEISLTITIENKGVVDLNKEITLQLVSHPNDSIITQYLIDEGLAADSSMLVDLTLNSLSLGLETLGIAVSHDLKDRNPANDSRFVNLTVSNEEQIDLAITSMKAPSTLVLGEEAEVSVTLSNMGSETIESGIILELFKQNEDNLLDNQVLNEELDSSASRTFSFNWDTRNEAPGSYEIIARHTFEDNTPQNNRGVLTINIEDSEPKTGADLAITSMEAPSTAEQGDVIEIQIGIRNNGNESVEEGFEIVLFNETYESIIEVIEFDEELNAGESTNLSFTWNTEQAAGGSHTLLARHNFEDGNAQNNARSVSINIETSSSKDVAITNFQSPSEASQGEEITFSFSVTNTGQADIFGEEINIELFDETDGVIIGNRQINDGLEIGESREIEINWNTESATIGQHSIRVSHDLNDSDENNNNSGVQIQIIEADQNFTISSFSPNEMERNSEERFTITGTAFIEGISIQFFRNNDDDDDAPRPVITDLDVLDENNMEMTVFTWWWGPRNINWSARFEHPDGTEIELNNVLRIRD